MLSTCFKYNINIDMVYIPRSENDKAEYVELSYKKGDIVAINGKTMSPASVMEDLNQRAGAHGIGRDDIVLVTFHALAQTKNRYKPYWHTLASVHL
jgi:argininosuccinate synthase